MPTQIDGLPVHPLLVHAPLVLVPMLVILVLLYVMIPPVRRHIGWAVFVLTILSPAAVFAARLSGEKLATAEIYQQMQKDITEHSGYSAVLIWLLVALAPITWLFAALERGRRSARGRRPEPAAPVGADGDDTATTRQLPGDDDPAGKGRRVVMIVLGLVMLGLVAVSAYYAFKAGDSGARMNWEGVLG